jgi:hypothetical protein
VGVGVDDFEFFDDRVHVVSSGGRSIPGALVGFEKIMIMIMIIVNRRVSRRG